MKDTEHEKQEKRTGSHAQRAEDERTEKADEDVDEEGGSSIHPEPLPPPERLAVDADDILAVADHYHQHDDEPDLNYDAPPPG